MLKQMYDKPKPRNGKKVDTFYSLIQPFRPTADLPVNPSVPPAWR